MTLSFSAPFNWCDSRCNRCPLAGGCGIASWLEMTRKAREERGEALHDSHESMAEMLDGLSLAREKLERTFEEEGISLEELCEVPARISLDDTALGKAAMEHAMAVKELVHELSDDQWSPMAGAAAGAMGGAFLICAKVGRVTPLDIPEDGPGTAAWRMDTVPNLLLMERTLQEVTFAMDQLISAYLAIRPGRYLRARGTLILQFKGWLDTIGEQDRALFISLTEAGKAPSPFCVVA